MTNYHPDVQRAYESHCADGYVVPDDETALSEASVRAVRLLEEHHPCVLRGGRAEDVVRSLANAGMLADDETGPQEPTGATESDETRVQAHGDGEGLREAVSIPLGTAEVSTQTPQPGEVPHMTFLGPDYRAEYDRTLARAEKAEAEVERLRESVRVDREVIDSIGRDADRWRRIHMFTAKGASRVQADLTAERDRARDTAAALEAENSRLTAKVERVEGVSDRWAWYAARCAERDEGHKPTILWEVAARKVRAALSDTTGEATR